MYEHPWIDSNGTVVDIDNIPEGVVGFVYCITNKSTAKAYLGKKTFYNRKTRSLKTKRRKKRTVVESDWKDYWSSSEELKRDIELLGKDQFERRILRFCKSKGEANYFELREQMLQDVLLKPGYYNSYVGTRIHRSHLKGITI